MVAGKARLYTAKYSEQPTRRSGRREFCKRLLILELTGLEAHSEYRLEVVDAGGQPVFQSHGAPQNNKLIATLAKGLRAGSYFVRVYANTGELLREYALTVRG